jgi:hypothetical protein
VLEGSLEDRRRGGGTLVVPEFLDVPELQKEEDNTRKLAQSRGIFLASNESASLREQVEQRLKLPGMFRRSTLLFPTIRAGERCRSWSHLHHIYTHHRHVALRVEAAMAARFLFSLSPGPDSSAPPHQFVTANRQTLRTLCRWRAAAHFSRN